MRISTTIVLGVIAIFLAIVISIVDRSVDSGKGAAEAANVLVRFQQEGVDQLVIEKGDAKVVMRKQVGSWFFTEPSQDRVNPSVAAALLDKLNHLTVVDRIHEGETLTPSQTGLGEGNAIAITLSGSPEKGDRINETIVLGGEAPRADSIYAKRGEKGEVLVVDGNPRNWLEQPMQTMRDPRILSAPVESIVQLGIRRSTGELQLQRKITPPQQDWALVKPLQTWASREKLDELLADLAGLQIEEVMVNAATDEPIPNPLPDGSAVLLLRVFGIEKPLTIYLKQIEGPPVEGAPSLVEARVSDRPSVYRFHSTILEKLPAKADDVRNRTLARIPMGYLDSIVIQSLIDPLVYLKSEKTGEGLRWDVKVNNKLLPANLGKISELVGGVNEAAIQDFASDTGENLADYGLLPPARRITFAMKFPGQPNEDGTPGQVQEMKRILNLGWKEGDEQRLFANFDGEPYVYELDPSFVNLIPTHPIKWRSLNVLTYNSFHLKSITREIPGRENLKLEYFYKRDDWDASRNGISVKSTLDPAAASRLRDRLGALTARGWYLSLASAYEALQTPSATFTIVTSELDRAIGEPVDTTYKLLFARSGIVLPPSSKPLYFGQIEGSPDVFFIDHETYLDLIRPVTTSRAAQ